MSLHVCFFISLLSFQSTCTGKLNVDKSISISSYLQSYLTQVIVDSNNFEFDIHLLGFGLF